MSTKKANANLKRMASKDTFDVKQAGSGVFIEGFANKATVDRGDELIATDAWELDNFKRNPIILFNHGMDMLGGTPVGKATEIRPTDEGLFLKVKMSNSQSPGIQMVRDLVEERILKAFSVGFNPKQADTVEIDGKKVQRISKAELFEVSIVGIPMNQDSLFDLSEKSVHQVKSLILKARGATRAADAEEILAPCSDRHEAMLRAAKSLGIEETKFFDMLAGDVEMASGVEDALRLAVKAVNLRATLEEALAKLDDEVSEDQVKADLLAALEGDAPEDTTDTTGTTEDTAKAKQDFQDCVNEMVPKLLKEGMEQDQAVAAAISKCQESGKCQLTPESKAQVYARTFEACEQGQAEKAALTEVVEFVKQADTTTEDPPSPTTPVNTAKTEDDFGSPFLEAAKQTNVLLGAVINELQKLGNKIDGLVTAGSVSSTNQEPPKDQANSTEGAGTKSALQEFMVKRVEALNERLRLLGC